MEDAFDLLQKKVNSIAEERERIVQGIRDKRRGFLEVMCKSDSRFKLEESPYLPVIPEYFDLILDNFEEVRFK